MKIVLFAYSKKGKETAENLVSYFKQVDINLYAPGRVADERFKANIDNAGGEGTAAFVQKAIAVYCKRAD